MLSYDHFSKRNVFFYLFLFGNHGKTVKVPTTVIREWQANRAVGTKAGSTVLPAERLTPAAVGGKSSHLGAWRLLGKS